MLTSAGIIIFYINKNFFLISGKIFDFSKALFLKLGSIKSLFMYINRQPYRSLFSDKYQNPTKKDKYGLYRYVLCFSEKKPVDEVLITGNSLQGSVT